MDAARGLRLHAGMRRDSSRRGEGSPISRRGFVGLAAAGLVAAARAAGAEAAAGRRLDFTIGPGFGSAPRENIEAVLRSAAEMIWRHCPDTRWEVSGFHVFHRDDTPITLDELTGDGRIAIGLATGELFWAQYAFQFAHEFAHALAGHSNDWRALHRVRPNPNHWIEESLCEVASLFALRAMGREWAQQAPYPNWRGFAPALNSYAAERMAAAEKVQPADGDFAAWFRAEEDSLRADACQRGKNAVVAVALLPLFEAEPAGWEALTFMNRLPATADQARAARFADWQRAAPEAQRAFIGRVANRFAEP